MPIHVSASRSESVACRIVIDGWSGILPCPTDVGSPRKVGEKRVKRATSRYIIDREEKRRFPIAQQRIL
jgi:hypothetical protein